MTSHRELFDEAEAALARAAAHTSETSAVSAAEGAQVGRQHDRLLAALRRHLEHLYGPGVAGMAEKQRPTDRDRTTKGLITALRGANEPEALEPAAEGECFAARALGEAADSIRLATDVLGTHHRSGYGGCTPDARVIEDGEARWGATVRAADLAYTAALTRSRLTGRLPRGQRAREARQVVDGAELLQASRGVLSAAAGTGPGAKGILELRPFATPLPDANPLAPAATALQYARAETHQLSLDRRIGVTTLRDMALLQLSIAQHADAITRAAAAQVDTHLPAAGAEAAAQVLAPAADSARMLARRWRDISGQLGSLRSADRPQAGLAHAGLAVRAALERHTRHEGRWATPAEMHATRQQMNELLTGIRAVALPLDEFTAAGRHSLAVLQRRGQLYIDARELPADPELLHAQRTGKYVPLPSEVSERLADAWRKMAETSRELTTALAASSGLVGHHPRPAAALARASGASIAQASAADTDSSFHSQHGDPSPRPPGKAKKIGDDTSVTGEATNIEAARQTLRAAVATAERASTAIDKLSASLTEVAVDAISLDAVAAVHEAANRLQTTANKALSGINDRHGPIEGAANSSPRVASTSFYRH